MRSSPFAIAAVLLTVGGGASGAAAQGDVDPNSARRIGFDDGSGENAWKVQSPSGPSDWFNVDLDDALGGFPLISVYCDSIELSGRPGNHADLAVFAEHPSFPNTPDVLTGRLAGRFAPSVAANDVAGSDDAFSVDVPKLIVPTGDYHVAVQFTSGDSHVWVAADTNSAPSGRSFFSATNYSSGAIPFSTNWSLATGVYESTEPGTLLVNGGASALVTANRESLCLLFFGPALHTMSVLYLCQSTMPFQIVLPPSYTLTDGVMAGPCPQTWQICAQPDCNYPLDDPFELCALYFDSTDLKPNGRPRTKLSTTVDVTITFEQGDECGLYAGNASCFGSRDDGILDAQIWKVQNPAGPSDWFNVNHGRPNDSVSILTGVSASAWDFCGFGPCWAEVGIYPPNTAVDPQGCIPDVTQPLASVRGTSACIPMNAGDWGVPLTFYDTPDIAAHLDQSYHAAVRWPQGDTCIWLGSDSDALDSSCGTSLPNNGCLSLFSTDAYATPGMTWTSANWMIRIKWN